MTDFERTESLKGIMAGGCVRKPSWHDFPVQVYSPMKGDILVIESERRLSQDVFERIQRQFREYVGADLKVVILEGGMTLKVVRDFDAEDVSRWEGEGGG